MNLALVATLVAILGGGGVLGWWRSTKPGRERAEAGWDAILGKPETKDRAGAQMEPAQVGLVSRVSDLEKASQDQAQAMKTMAEVLANQRELNDIVLSMQRETRMLGIRVTSLERHEEERIEMRRENTALFNAVAERDTINGESE